LPLNSYETLITLSVKDSEGVNLAYKFTTYKQQMQIYLLLSCI